MIITHHLLFWMLVLFVHSCADSAQSQRSETESEVVMLPKWEEDVAEYVTTVLQDSRGTLWLGTLNLGLAQVVGDSLIYITEKDGLPSNRITALVEDDGNLWIGTGQGLVTFDGQTFTTRTVEDGLCHNSISQLFRDSQNRLWIGTWGGVCWYDGADFNTLTLPEPNVQTPVNPDTKNWITDLEEDGDGNIWIARDGSGVFVYDGHNFTNYTKKEGLLCNNITELTIGPDGTMWMGSRMGEHDFNDLSVSSKSTGLCVFNNNQIRTFSDHSVLNACEIYETYTDLAGDIWVCTTEHGVYQYHDGSFKHHDVPISIMGMVQDRKGNYWLGGAGGLVRIDTGGKVLRINRNGPWN